MVPELEQQEPGIHGELVDVGVYTVRAQYCYTSMC